MAFTPVEARCKNCGDPYTKTQAHQLFCKPRCRRIFHALGKTPEMRIEKMVTRLVKKLLPSIVAKEVNRAVDKISAEMREELVGSGPIELPKRPVEAGK